MQNIFIDVLPPWVETGLQPAFYDLESGTVLQQTSRMYAKVRELTQAFNDFSESVTTEVTTFENNVTETVNDYIQRFNTLYTYVHDYFDNLDVQEEINNKLDAMTEDGTLAEIVISYFNYVTPEMYGAIGDGTTDDTEAMQDALDEAISNHRLLKLGYMKTYRVSSITADNHFNLDGNYATIKSTDGNTADGIINLEGEGSVDSTIKRLTIDGNRSNISTAVKGIRFYNTTWKDTHTLIEEVTVMHCKGDAIYMGGLGRSDVRELRLSKLNVHDNDANGICAVSFTDSFITESIFYNNGLNGIYLEVAGSIKIDGCKCYWNGNNSTTLADISRIPANAFVATTDATPIPGKYYFTRSGYGDFVTPYTFTQFTGDSFDGGTTYYECNREGYVKKYNGININACSNIMIVNTEIQDNAGDGIYIEGGNQNSIIDTAVDNNGLLTEGTTTVSYASKNIVPFYYGIYIKGCVYNNILASANNFRYNYIGYSQRAGLYLENTNHNNITITSRLQQVNIDYTNINLNQNSIQINGLPLRIDIPFRLLTVDNAFEIITSAGNGSYMYVENGTFHFKIVSTAKGNDITTGTLLFPVQFPSNLKPKNNYDCLSFTATERYAYDRRNATPLHSYINYYDGKLQFRTEDAGQKNFTIQGQYDLSV